MYELHFLKNCVKKLCGALSGPLTYEEVASICSNPKPGVSGVSLDYKHIRYAGPSLWMLLFHMYQQVFFKLRSLQIPENGNNFALV